MKLILLSIIFTIGIFTHAQQINWLSLQEAEKAIAENPDKPLLIDFYTSWCGFCVKMDNSTFKDKAVIAYINENYIPVKFNAEIKEEVSFKGKSYRYIEAEGGRGGVNAFAYFSLKGVLSYPSYAIADENARPYKILKGFHPVKEFIEAIKVE